MLKSKRWRGGVWLGCMQAQTSSRHVFPRAISVAGALHITVGLTREVIECLRDWRQCIDGLSLLSLLLGNTYNRERYIATCLRASPFASLEHLFRKNLPTTIHWRWDSTLLFLYVGASSAGSHLAADLPSRTLGQPGQQGSPGSSRC